MRVVIADDEQLARRRLRRLLEAVSGVRIVAEAINGEETLQAIDEHQPDAAFLDIHMPGLTGVEVADLLGPSGPLVVFLTAHADHAVDAFRQGAVDYVLKPADAARIRLAVDRIRERLPEPSGPPGKLVLATRNGAVLLDHADISHLTIDGASVVVHTRERSYFSDQRLADLERRLTARFLRVHRQAIVNLDQVARLDDVDSGGYLAHLHTGDVVTVSRAAARRLRREWGLPR